MSIFALLSSPIITFVNHASVIFSYEKINLITDPWLFGSAFNDSWDLISESKMQPKDFKNISHIWFSHEHPDHFSPSNLKKIPKEIGNLVNLQKLYLYNNQIKDNRIFDLLGREWKSDFADLPKGVYIINGKKVIKTK